MKAKINIFFAVVLLVFFLSACGGKEVKPEDPAISDNKSFVQESSDKSVTKSDKEEVTEKKVEETSDKNTSDEDEEELSDEELDEEFYDEEENEEVIESSDPLYYFNVAMYHVTDKTYYWVLKPAAQGYRFIMPEIARIWVRNFFYNLGMPVRFVGNVLQFKLLDATKELGRFIINTTVGILGFGNPAGYFDNLTPTPEDLGQAFGKWGIGEGFYLFLPFYGPYTLRDTVGFIGEQFLDPINYLDADILTKFSITGFKTVNNVSLQLGTYEAIKEAALDPYLAIKNGYLQRRRKEVAD